SATGFSKLGDVSATNSSTYQHVDELPLPLFNYYRIKAIGLNGEVLYSNVVKVGPEKINSAIQVYPNPIADKEMGIYFNNVQPGNYLLQLIQSDGKIIQKEVFALSTASHTYRMPVNKSLASGNYILQILCNNKQVAKIPVSIL
ncbi:MAG TPA: T9SS type A sorting domain-containing protein, partial [Ferruginibacter sp.]|nr:T9SS type A sorting domain-containing protein [Ferruginibacter sp.]